MVRKKIVSYIGCKNCTCATCVTVSSHHKASPKWHISQIKWKSNWHWGRCERLTLEIIQIEETNLLLLVISWRSEELFWILYLKCIMYKRLFSFVKESCRFHQNIQIIIEFCWQFIFSAVHPKIDAFRYETIIKHPCKMVYLLAYMIFKKYENSRILS